MAEVPTSTDTVRLQVAGAQNPDVGKGVARMSQEALAQLGIVPGAIVELRGPKNATAAIAQRAEMPVALASNGRTAVDLAAAVIQRANPSDRVVVVQAEGGSPDAVDTLRIAGFDVRAVSLSKTRPNAAFVREAQERAAIYADWTDQELWDHVKAHPVQDIVAL